MTITGRAIRYAIVHPIRSWRFVKAVRAPWPLYILVDAERIVAEEAHRAEAAARRQHPSSRRL